MILCNNLLHIIFIIIVQFKMSIFNCLDKKLLIILVCLAIPGNSFASKPYKCQVVGKLFLKKEIWQKNISISLNEDAIRSPKTRNRVVQELNLTTINAESLFPEDLTINLKIQTIPNTNILNISYSHSNSNLAAKVVNSVMKNYLEEFSFQFQQQAAISKKLIENDLARNKNYPTIT
jgi:hypothetical protein